jgi:hypothetical protein
VESHQLTANPGEALLDWGRRRVRLQAQRKLSSARRLEGELVKRLALLVAAALLLPVVGGCGGGGGGDRQSGSAEGDRLSKAAYEQKWSDLNTELATQFASLGRTPTTVTELRAYYRKLADGWATLAKRLAAINPPAEIDKEHTKVVDAANSMAEDLRAAAEKKEPKLLDASKLPGYAQIQEALQAISDKGYSFSSEPVTTTVQGG